MQCHLNKKACHSRLPFFDVSFPSSSQSSSQSSNPSPHLALRISASLGASVAAAEHPAASAAHFLAACVILRPSSASIPNQLIIPHILINTKQILI